MPQMMPMSWLSLFIMFSVTLTLFATLNYYTMNPKTKASRKKKSPSKKTLTWKW
uniref:ATP synthase complex subunit 8 n=1 Tax=Cryptotermes sp. 7 AB-2022a TaxID=2942710 RepID=A0A8X8RHX9_9NEOP|nr:ATP synthase F0 subunit 8 [Cryptotermes dudleyi]URX54126.1 ATP synthase F0 subunit 8 [Cryptotermes sp. 7 AB-2022a]URX54217.1 ATP synthase F0 subunit 8 [Cryptotermes sp. 7 AB-2022a]URX54243.1 ATP synthase F0 subunit 8 [Cryptotermes sp. 7 AB-2022a]URX54295.1 ATP synthase F0 subunit 8 [Cryptotermes sp. 7 AB-2022a]